MKNTNSLTFITFFWLTIFYFVVTVSMYYISIYTGSMGINVKIFGGGDDGIFYYEQAVKFANGEDYIATSAYVYFTGFIFMLLNTEEVIFLRLLNLTGIVGVLIVSLLLFKQLINDNEMLFKWSPYILITISIYPSFLLNTTISLYRDMWIILFYLLCLYFSIEVFIKKKQSFSIWKFILLGISMWLLFSFRRYALLSIILGIIVYLIFINKNKAKINYGKLMSIFIILFSIIYIFFKEWKFPLLNYSLADALSYRLSGIESYSGGSQMNIILNQPNLIDFYLNYFYSVFSNMLGPFPWQLSGIATLILMLTEGVVLIILFIKIMSKRIYFNNTEKFIFIQAIIWFMLIGVTNDNLGSASRLRMIAWIPLIILYWSLYIKRK